MTVREAQSRISSAEFAEWIAYHQLEPWGEERADLRCAIIAATVANCHRGRNSPTFKPLDFMAVRPPRRPKTPAEHAQAVGVMAAMLKARGAAQTPTTATR